MSVLGPWEALGTHWYLEFFETVDKAQVLKETQTLLSEFEKNYSRFLSDSLVSRLNREREIVDPPVEFVELLQISLDYYRKTDGVFNIAVGEKMVASGYDDNYSFTAKKNTEKSQTLLQLTGVMSVIEELVSLKDGQIDLGGIGKGYVIDKLANHLKTKLGLSYFLINGGGDIYASSDQGNPVEIGLAHPTDRTKVIGKVNLINQGFAASSPYVRTWKDRDSGKEYNHLHTNNQVASYTVAPTATEADVWATTLAIKPDLLTSAQIYKLLIKDSKVLFRDQLFQLN